MAARRLIVIMLILLGVSTLLAAALPDRVRQGEDDQTASEATTTETAPTGATTTEAAVPAAPTDPCKTVLKCFQLDADKQKVQVIPVEQGDQVVIEVSSTADDTVEIGDLGFIDVVGPDSPATFDILADRPGSFGISLVDAARPIGRIEVSPEAPAESG